ncbi:glycoside hydrolase family 16 protein [Annulohypoxylon maeteangense]|uniref:glycoside hydrolase family 16 protein n=1 Tax=Annulohypoxylon maeteangense TaxID=1927788 RepID=UPI002008E52D|nr:glycoside hydrolase family 16 protein [Annulohypoxylon maeteangense]KAI0887815.1 glycoside hydrolase family 16 protein [Annulohypoxylon maeteangense]
MFSKILSATTVVLAATQMVSAQTSTACDPTKKTCPDDPALGTSVSIDFTKGKNDLFTDAAGTTLKYDGNGAVFTINKATDAPTITSNKYIFFGKVELVVQAAPGAGIVTSFVLQSDDLDEIDWEWIGSDKAQVQSNYFGKGDTTTFDRGAYHAVANPQDNYDTYTIDWTKDYVRWIINGNQVRELKYADAKSGTRFPQTPMQIKLGTWCAGGPDSPEGTAQWAGGRTDFSQAPFVAHYKTLTITDYSNGVKNAEKYSWSSGSDGSYGSINVITGDGSSSSGSSSSATSSAKSSATSGASSATKSSETKSTLSTATVSATASGSATSGSGSSASSTATSSGNNASASASSSGSASAANTSAPVATTNGALKTGFSVSALAAGLMVVFML